MVGLRNLRMMGTCVAVALATAGMSSRAAAAGVPTLGSGLTTPVAPVSGPPSRAATSKVLVASADWGVSNGHGWYKVNQ